MASDVAAVSDALDKKDDHEAQIPDNVEDVRSSDQLAEDLESNAVSNSSKK